jgi:His/Glu/Gln/Arg/opine family amino acid ABC transporter permease subunit
MFFDFKFWEQLIPDIIKAIPVTVFLTTVPILTGILFGFFIAMIRNYHIVVLEQLAAFFVSFIRGTPMFVLLFVFYYALPRVLGLSIEAVPPLLVATLTFVFYCTAYLSEIIRGALKSVDVRQIEAARSIGMTTATAYRRIILPQALMVAIPNFFNYTAAMLKNSSLVFAVGVIDIMAASKIDAEKGYRFIEGYATVAIFYVVFSLVIAFVFKRFEKSALSKMGEQAH